MITKETKHNIIDKVFSEEMRTFLKVVCDHEKMTIAEQIFAAYEELQNQAAGVKTVYLRYTALPSEEQKKQMGDFIKKKYGAGDIKWLWQKTSTDPADLSCRLTEKNMTTVCRAV